MSDRPEMIDQAFYNGIANLVDASVRELITTERDIEEDLLPAWQEEVNNWFYHQLIPTARNHQYREWYIHRSILQLTGFDALETSLLHLAFQQNPSALVTPERLVAEKLLVVPPQTGWQRFWYQERRLQAGVAQLIEERGWVADEQDSIMFDKDPFFAGRLMRDETGRILVVIAGKDSDPNTGLIGPMDSRNLCLTLHDARRHAPVVQAGGIVTIDPHSLVVNWHEAVYDETLGLELADLRTSVWTRHVLEEEPLPDHSLQSSPKDNQVELSSEQLNHLQFLIMQHRLGRLFNEIASNYVDDSRKLLHQELLDVSLAPNDYTFGDYRVSYQLTRDPSGIRQVLANLQESDENYRRPLKKGEEGEFNRIPIHAMLAELKTLQASGDADALEEGIDRLLRIPVELGPIDMKKAADFLMKSKMVAGQEIHRERLETSVLHADWDKKSIELKETIGSFYEDLVKEIWGLLRENSEIQ